MRGVARSTCACDGPHSKASNRPGSYRSHRGPQSRSNSVAITYARGERRRPHRNELRVRRRSGIDERAVRHACHVCNEQLLRRRRGWRLWCTAWRRALRKRRRSASGRPRRSAACRQRRRAPIVGLDRDNRQQQHRNDSSDLPAEEARRGRWWYARMRPSLPMQGVRGRRRRR